jgi:hypothetical protein
LKGDAIVVVIIYQSTNQYSKYELEVTSIKQARTKIEAVGYQSVVCVQYVSRPKNMRLVKAIMVTIYVCDKTFLQILNPLPANGEL